MLSKATVKYIQSLHQKRVRSELNIFLAEGSVMLQEMLQQPELKAVQLFSTTHWWQLLPVAIKERCSAINQLIEPFELQKISARESATGGLCIFQQRTVSLQSCYPTELCIALADIQDPGNLGTIIRTADWFGIKNIICSENTVECYNPKVVQSTMGSIGRVAVHYTDLPAWLSASRSPIFAARLNGANIKSVGRPPNGVILIGNEAKGIPAGYDSENVVDVSIAGIGHSESLNAAVAAAIIMYEFCQANL